MVGSVLLSSEPPDRSRHGRLRYGFSRVFWVFSGTCHETYRDINSVQGGEGPEGKGVYEECMRGDMALYGMGSEYYSEDMCLIMNMMTPQYTEYTECE